MAFMKIFTFRVKNWFSTKLLVFIFLFISDCVVCQSPSERIDISKLMLTEMTKHLDPSIMTNDTTKILLFKVCPEVNPNSSLRIVKTKGLYYLEVRYLEINIGKEIFTSFLDNNKYHRQSFKVHLLSVPISKSFMNKMVDAFYKAIALNEEKWRLHQIEMEKTPGIEIYDGGSYELSICDNGKTMLTSMRDNIPQFDSKFNGASDIRYLIKTTNLQIIKDVKSKTFCEMKYLIYR